MVQPEVRVTVVYCAPSVEDLTELSLPTGATAADAVRESGVAERHPEIAAGALAIGIWGRACTPAQPLDTGDRVEVYRPLTVDPKEARRVRAEVRRRRSAG